MDGFYRDVSCTSGIAMYTCTNYYVPYFPFPIDRV